MPLCTLHLLALHQTTPNPIPTFLSTLHSAELSPLVISRVIRWIILPSKLSTEHLLARNISWDLFLILPSSDPSLPPSLQQLIQHHWSVTAGVPSRLTQDFAARNAALLHPPDASTVPALTTANANARKTAPSSQNLELSADLNTWIEAFVRSGKKEATGAVSMFNLLAFHPGMKSEYLKYGAAFAQSIGSAHGGNAKIVGNVTHVHHSSPNSSTNPQQSTTTWDEIALAHYPSILHFRDMLTSEKYQEVNQRHRVPSLMDTCILMTSEIAVEEVVKRVGEAKL